MKGMIHNSLIESAATIERIVRDDSLCNDIEKAAFVCAKAINEGNKIMLCGNGGSAADAQHIAAELVGRFEISRPGLPAIALTTDTSVLTAISNDYGFNDIFSRQVQAIGKSGDVLIAISTSGKSPNILNAITEAKAGQVKVIGLTGESDEKMHHVCDITLKVPSSRTPRIQESHILIGHILCELIEKALFGAQNGKK